MATALALHDSGASPETGLRDFRSPRADLNGKTVLVTGGTGSFGKAFVRMVSEQADLTALHGCPHGSLCSELDKRGDGLDRDAARIIELSIDWAEEQFRQMGRRDARDLAVALIASYQGISLLTNTFRDPDLMRREGKRIERWIDSL